MNHDDFETLADKVWDDAYHDACGLVTASLSDDSELTWELAHEYENPRLVLLALAGMFAVEWEENPDNDGEDPLEAWGRWLMHLETCEGDEE